MADEASDAVFVRWAQQELDAEIVLERAERAELSDTASTPVRDLDLFRYAHRDPKAAVDLSMERLIRSDPEVNRRYSQMLDGIALQTSPVALAAATEGEIRREIGRARLRFVEAPDCSTIVLEIPQGDPIPTQLDMIGEDDMLRIPLVAPIDGLVQIPVDLKNENYGRVAALLRSPQTAIRLI